MNPNQRIHILAHAPSSNTAAILDAIFKGCKYGLSSLDAKNIKITCSAVADSDHEVINQVSGVIVFTPANFGYMSGALKDWFDRCFYCLEGRSDAMPYALCVRGKSDCTGAVRSVETILSGLKWRPIYPAKSLIGDLDENMLDEAHEFGAQFSASIALGIA